MSQTEATAGLRCIACSEESILDISTRLGRLLQARCQLRVYGLMPDGVCFQELDAMPSTAPMCATDWVSVLQHIDENAESQRQ